MSEQDVATRRARDLERYHRRTAERRAKGLCPKCGKRPPAPHRTQCEPCAEKQRARDLERYHRRTAERIARGLCPKCGKRPPAPHRTQCEPCAEKQRARDLERYHRRTAERIARGLCPKCGKRPPEPERSQCGPCLAKDAAAGRARDARPRAAGMPRRDPGKARIAERRRRERQIAECRAAGLCPECGKAPPAPGRTVCEPCGEAQRATARARYAKGKAAGKLYGGRNVETRRRIGREKSARRRAARLAAGLCTSCGTRPSADDGTQCEPCARRSYHRSQHFRGLPLYPPQYTVVELSTGDDHGTYDSWDEVALCLAFARLSLDEVEVLTDQSPMATYAAWE